MTVRKYAVRILLLALPLCAGISASAAVSDSLLDDQADSAKTNGSAPSNWSEPATTVVEVTIPPSKPGSPSEPILSANPLWAMPIKQFAVTRDRPIFLPSRRPPAAVSAVTVAKAIVPPRPKEPEQPQLSLVGTISGDDDKFGIFIDQSTKAVLRLRVGEEFQGWKLQSVQGREAAFQKNQLSFVVTLPQPGLSQPSVVVHEEPVDTRLLPVNARPARNGRQ